MPGEQSLWRSNICDFVEFPKFELIRLPRQPTSLIIGESQSLWFKVGAKNPDFLLQMLNNILLTPVHPTSNTNQNKTHWIRAFRLFPKALNCPFSPLTTTSFQPNQYQQVAHTIRLLGHYATENVEGSAYDLRDNKLNVGFGFLEPCYSAHNPFEEGYPNRCFLDEKAKTSAGIILNRYAVTEIDRGRKVS